MKDTSFQCRNQSQNENIVPRIDRFLRSLSISSMLSRANIRKINGISPLILLTSLMTMVFSKRNYYRVYSSGSEGFKTDTAYRFLGHPDYNWRQLLLRVARVIIRELLIPLTSAGRVNCLILDSSVYPRNRSRKVELLSWVHDHVTGLNVRGFQKLLLAWTDGYSTVPLQHALLSCRDESKRIFGLINKELDRRSCGARRRKEALTSMPDVSVQMIRRAKRWGIPAKYVLMDSWFTLPKTILRIRSLGIHLIGMIKRSSRIHYLFEGQELDVMQIYRRLRKQRGRAKILTSAIVQFKDSDVSAKIVFVRNRNARREWLALISTRINLPDEEIVRIYGYRWNIEILFKVAKHYLKLTTEIQSRSYDALIAHSTIVLLRYCFLELERRNDADGRSHGELFYACTDEIRDVSFFESLQLLLAFIIEKIRKFQNLTENTISQLIDAHLETLESLYPQLVDLGCGS
ncbi:IS4 family transposase [bacterium]|nr:MAG: IS4 family transposase [bacterium]